MTENSQTGIYIALGTFLIAVGSAIGAVIKYLWDKRSAAKDTTFNQVIIFVAKLQEALVKAEASDASKAAQIEKMVCSLTMIEEKLKTGHLNVLDLQVDVIEIKRSLRIAEIKNEQINALVTALETRIKVIAGELKR